MNNKQNKINTKEDKIREEIDKYDDEYVNHLILIKNKEIAGKEATMSARGLLGGLLFFCGICISFASNIISMIFFALGFIPSIQAVVDLIMIQKDTKFLKLLNEKQVKSYKEFRESLEKNTKQKTVTNQKSNVKTNINTIDNTTNSTIDVNNDLGL